MTNLSDVTDTVTTKKPETKSEMTPAELRRLQQERLALKIQAYFVRFLFVFQGFTQLPISLHYLIDFAFMNLPYLVRLGLKLWACHLCLVGAVNWVCLIYYSNEYNPKKHRPETTTPPDDSKEHSLLQDESDDDNNSKDTKATSSNTNHVDSQTSQNTNAQINKLQNNKITNADDKHLTGNEDTTPASFSREESVKGDPLPWTYCQHCKMNTPPRTRHCKKCETCIVRRDHHCELVGMCVGHRNQRFFIVLANYGIFVANIGAYMTLTYLYHHHPEGTSLWDYFIPVTFFKGLRGSIPAFQVLLTYHAYMLVAFCPLTIVYFFSELSVVLQGKTMREVLKKMKHIKVSSSPYYNMTVVFGDNWWLNFLFPTLFFIPHTHNGLDFPQVTVTNPTTSTAPKSSSQDDSAASMSSPEVDKKRD